MGKTKNLECLPLRNHIQVFPILSLHLGKPFQTSAHVPRVLHKELFPRVILCKYTLISFVWNLLLHGCMFRRAKLRQDFHLNFTWVLSEERIQELLCLLRRFAHKYSAEHLNALYLHMFGHTSKRYTHISHHIIHTYMNLHSWTQPQKKKHFDTSPRKDQQTQIWNMSKKTCLR